MIYMIITGLLCGAALGFVMQRGRFCLTGGFRDMYLSKNNRIFYALLLAIAVQSIGVFLLMDLGVFQYSAGTFPIVAVIFGSYIFGIGIILAGGCATGTWYRAGEGLIGSWIALFGYMVMSTIMKTGVLAPLNQKMQQMAAFPTNSIADTFGVNHWILVILFAIIVGIILYKELKKPKIVVPTLKPKRKGLAHILFEKRWNPFVTASLIGVIALLAWPLSAATGRVFGLGITTPTANILQFLTTGDKVFINWGVFLVLGVFLGSFIAAKGSNEFRFRMPDVKTAINSFIGGNLMGVGASLAGGCSIGNGLVMTAVMTWQGWIGLLFMILGTWTASYFVYVRPRQKAKSVKLDKQVASV